jgi:hypothetical protein
MSMDDVDPGSLAALLDAWAALCAAAGRRSLTLASALEAGTAEQREACALALVALGYPEAWTTPNQLGAAFRSLRRQREGGRRLGCSRGMAGGSIWYVVRTSHE